MLDMNNLNHQTKSHMSSPSLSSYAIGRTAPIPPPSGRLFLPCLLDKTAEWGHNKINLMLSLTYAKRITVPNLNKKRGKIATRQYFSAKYIMSIVRRLQTLMTHVRVDNNFWAGTTNSGIWHEARQSNWNKRISSTLPLYLSNKREACPRLLELRPPMAWSHVPNVYSSVDHGICCKARDLVQTKTSGCCGAVKAMEDTIKSEPTYKSKISFSVESLLSSKDKTKDEQRLDDDEEEEDITVDEDTEEDLDGRESASPGGAHTVLVPQPLHPSVPRLLAANPHHPQWPFSWMGHPAAMVRSGSPQSKLVCVQDRKKGKGHRRSLWRVKRVCSVMYSPRLFTAPLP